MKSDSSMFSKPHELEKFIHGALPGLAMLYKTIAHQRRLEVLSLLISSPKSFGTLLNETQLQKTALANHLSQLLETKLVERVDRGNYRITKDGYDFLEVTASIYYGSEVSVQFTENLPRYQTVRMNQSGELLMKTVSKEPIYQGCWISYLGAVAGVLQSYGLKYDIVDVAGYSGYGFFYNVHKTTCPSGPTAFSKQTFKEIIRGTESLGVTIHVDSDIKGFPQKPGPLSAEDALRAKTFFEKVKKVIERDIPAIIWGIPVPEYGIVKGIDEAAASYLVSTFRHLNNTPENPIKYTDLQAPGCMDLIVLEKNGKQPTIDDDKQAIDRAIMMLRAKEKSVKDYTTGPAAFNVWADTLQHGTESQLNYHGNSYIAMCYQESCEVAAKFLERLAAKYPGKNQTKLLLEAQQLFNEASKQLLEFQQLFPFPKGEMTIEKRTAGAKFLKMVFSPLSNATDLLEKISNVWE